MASTQSHLRALFQAGTAVGLADGALLGRFLDGPAEVAEHAFTAIVERHGGMVLRACRQVTHDRHDAEDAAQATFLVLARSARSLRSSDSLATWLRGVARRVSARINADAERRRARERRSGGRVAESAIPGEAYPEVHEEIARLPERYRLPIVLCHLEGLSHAQAADRLRCPVRTLQTRLARGRERLRTALVRRGVGPADGAILPALAEGATPTAWARATVRLAMDWSPTAGAANAGAVPAAAALAEEVVRIMVIKKATFALLVALLAAASVAGTRAWTGSGVTLPGIATSGGMIVPGDPGGRRPPSDAAGARAQGFAIRGRVAGPDGSPLAGAEVSSPFLEIREGRATTGPDGGFTITAEERPRAEYVLRVDAPGHATKMFAIETEQGPPSTAPIGPAPPSRPSALLRPTGVLGDILTLDPGSVVAGRVVREGEPVAGAAVGLWRDSGGYDRLLAPEEVRADAEGRFRFPHAPGASPCWVYVSTGSLVRAGAVRPVLVQTPEVGGELRVGDLEVRPGRTVSGRVVLADGEPLPAGGEVLAAAAHAGGLLRAGLDPGGRFTLAGMPEGEVEIFSTFPGGTLYTPAGFRASPRNRCLDPLNPWRLVGRVDRDVTDLTILYERGETPPPSTDPEILEAFREARGGPIAGVPPALDE